MQEVIQTGQLVMPTGRVYTYKTLTNHRGERTWPRTTILNYPVQGLGADIMTIVRVDFFNRLQQLNLQAKIINTVHDSIVVDCPQKEVDTIAELFYNIYTDVPKNFKKLFGVEYNLPLTNEISIGPNLKDLTEI